MSTLRLVIVLVPVFILNHEHYRNCLQTVNTERDGNDFPPRSHFTVPILPAVVWLAPETHYCPLQEFHTLLGQRSSMTPENLFLLRRSASVQMDAPPGWHLRNADRCSAAYGVERIGGGGPVFFSFRLLECLPVTSDPAPSPYDDREAFIIGRHVRRFSLSHSSSYSHMAHFLLRGVLLS